MELQTMQAQRAPPAPLVRGSSHLPGPQIVQGRAALAGGRGQREGGAWQSKVKVGRNGSAEQAIGRSVEI